MLVPVLAFPIAVFGRLGETEQELIARFGAPASRGSEMTIAQGKIIVFGSTLAFRQGDWDISCAVIEGRCAKEFYSKSRDWTEDQFAAVLTSNAQGARWNDTSVDMVKKLSREWDREDGGSASWHLGAGLAVTNPAYDRAKQRAETKAKADASKIPNL